MSITPLRPLAGFIKPLGRDQWQNRYYASPDDPEFPLLLDGVNGPSVNVGGSNRRLVGVFTRVAGQWRVVPSAWARVAGEYRPWWGDLLSFVVSFTAASVEETTFGPAKGEIQFRRNGEIWGDKNSGAPYYIADWVDRKNSTVGDRFWIRATATAGAFDNGLQTWQRLNADRLWNCLATLGTSSCTFTLEIATDASGANIVFTRTGNLLTADDIT